MSAMKFREPNEVLWRGVRPGHRGEQVAEYKEVANGTAIVYTVGAGKTFFMTTANFICDSSVTATLATLYVRNASDVLQYYLGVAYFRAVGQIVAPMTFNPPLEIPAGWDVVIASDSANLKTRAFIHGWEE